MPQIAMLCKKYRVTMMYVFGSASTDVINENSDVDFLISFQNDVSLEEYADNYFELMLTFRTKSRFSDRKNIVQSLFYP
jgi:hypothetical protein